MKNKYFLLFLAALLFIVAYLLYQPFTVGSASSVVNVERKLHQKEHRLNSEMLTLAERSKSESYHQLFSEKPNYYSSLLADEGLVLLIYENDTLKYWSDNSIAVENWRDAVCLDTRMVKLHNGWFEVMRPETNAFTTKTVVGLILLKNEYPYENKYLVNEFQKGFAVPVGTKLSIDDSQPANQVKSLRNDYLFSLVFGASNNTFSISSYFSLFLTCFGFCLLFVFINKLLSSYKSRLGNNISLAIFIVIVLTLRYFTIQFSFPAIFYDFELFSPSTYADASSVWLTSLGDLLINTFLLFYISYTLVQEFTIDSFLEKMKKASPLIISLIYFLLFYGFTGLITAVFKGLISNSNIPFGITNLYSLNQYSYIALVIIALLLFVCFLFADKLISVVRAFHLSNQQYILIFVISSLLHIVIWHLLGTRDLIFILWPLVILITIAIIKRIQAEYHFSSIVFLVFVFSLFAVHVILKQTGNREIEARKIYAKKLVAEQDPVTEFLFQEVAKKIAKDSSWLYSATKGVVGVSEFEKRIKQNYFSGFWDKYDISISMFDSMCLPIAKSVKLGFDNTMYFDNLIEEKGVETSNKHLTFLRNTSGKVSYLATFPLVQSFDASNPSGTLYIELDAKFISDEIGFPELLLDKNIGISNGLRNYSYAKYKNNVLVNQFGSHSYQSSGDRFEGLSIYSTFDKEGLSHLVYRPDTATLIVLSEKQKSVVDKVTTFSYLFSFFSVLLLSLLLIRYVWQGSLFDNFSFKYRIQLLLVFIVLISLGLFGGGTIYYIKKQFEEKNRDNIRDKIHSVLIDIDGKLADEKSLEKPMAEYASYLLKKWSNIFFTDINLYDVDGNLYASSRPAVFDEGLTSKKMNPEAYLQMGVLGKKEFIHDERIGKLEYLSAYHSFKNNDGKLLAYINLPYFAKQSELEKEISGFLVALINIYVLLFALSILMAILISNYVTKPLKLIQDKLSKIQLGTTNELIDWQDKDEIGSLVSEYNRMILELSQSAELLAKSERESAWREMAKQVAHEIKNPLTPMKLSVQHLQRIWKDRSTDMDQKMERLTQTIIEQIDTLSTIATEFSNFAKMPKANASKISLGDILSNSIALFTDTDNVNINYTNAVENNSYVFADKEQLLRVFNNLIKNAIQAIPENRVGEIDINLKRENDNYIIAVADNGIGIDAEVLDKIFVPNFTTKTGGTGLGLAMVKSIVETFEGEIWFENRIEKGCTFYISVPCHP